MFLKTEQFEYNGVSVTLLSCPALQRIEHLALLKRRAEEAESQRQPAGECGRSCQNRRVSGGDVPVA
ncbi:minor tail protein G [Escherichia coli]|uniref:Minor tail protein G n=1 Tax=Escherichia coli TaxID=562 RepID=A0A376UBV9_ECOLX|nr:minor tail protein G [Escherichia coli]